MKRGNFILLILFICLFILNNVSAQNNPPFYKDIQVFKQQDQLSTPQKGAILFIGSSSFTMWKDIQNDFPGYSIINRGFGGSSLTDLIRYAPDIIYPYNASQIVIYCGENDFVSASNVTADTVFNRFKQLFTMIRTEVPKAHILFISIKPSPSRAKYMPEMQRANVLIQSFLKKKAKTGFVDVYHKMLLNNGSPMPNIFLVDKLHMNRSGYDIWQKAILPYLRK